jgi:hypothetical protein
MAKKSSSKAQAKVEEKKVEQTTAKAEPKFYKIRFETESGLPYSFKDHGLEYSKNIKGDIVTHTMLQETPFEIKNGQTLEIDEDTYNYLKDKGAILSPVEKDARDRLKRKKMRKRSVRAEPKKDVQTWDAKTKNAVFNDLPYDVVE